MPCYEDNFINRNFLSIIVFKRETKTANFFCHLKGMNYYNELLLNFDPTATTVDSQMENDI